MGAFQDNREEIYYNLINSAIAGALVFFGALVGTNGHITLNAVISSVFSAAVVAITKFKNYWESQEKEYKKGLLTFF